MDQYSNGRGSILFPARRNAGKLTSAASLNGINVSFYMSPKTRKKIVEFSANILENVEIAGSRNAVRDLLASTLQKNHIAVKLKKVLLPLRETPNVDRLVCLDTHPLK